MAEPAIDDFAVIGGAGAYCASMTPFNYNSHTQIPLIRKRQTLEQMLENEL
jgi:diaminopimelate decarboxylase